MKTVIFDLDGTLVYQPPGIILESNVRVVEFLDPHCADPVGIVKEVYAETTNNGGLLVTKAKQIKIMADKLSIKVDQNKINEALDIFLSNYIPPLTFHDDSLPTIQKLEGMGFRMGIATNGAHDVQPKTIEKFDLMLYFDFVVISSEVNASKDSKKYIRHLIDNCGIIPDETLVVGDTLPDFLLAKGLETMVYIVDRNQGTQSRTQRNITNPIRSEQQQLSSNPGMDEIPRDIIIPTLSIIPEILTGW